MCNCENSKDCCGDGSCSSDGKCAGKKQAIKLLPPKTARPWKKEKERALPASELCLSLPVHARRKSELQKIAGRLSIGRATRFYFSKTIVFNGFPETVKNSTLVEESETETIPNPWP